MIIVLLAQFAAVVILFTFEASVHYYLADGLQHSILFYGMYLFNMLAKHVSTWF